MGLSDWWREERDRERDDRERREAERGRAAGRAYHSGSQRDEEFERGGSRAGGDYYRNRDERYGGGEFAGQGRGASTYGASNWDDQRSGRSGEWRGRGGESSGRSFNERWENSYRGSGERDTDRGPYSFAPSDRQGNRGWGGYGEDFGDYREYGGQRTAGGSPWSQGRTGGFGNQTSAFGYGAGTQEEQRGSYRGLGPRGYRRSDERIKEDVCECLTEDDHIDASNIEVAVKDCEVTLTGTVNSREEKRHAEDIIERLSGVRDVNNDLRVASQAQNDTTMAQGRQSGSSQPGQSGQANQSTQSSRH